MIFLAAADDAAAATANAAEETTELDYKAQLCALLGLDPATATDAEITAKIPEVQGVLGGVSELQTKASTADQLQAQLDEINRKYQELADEQQRIYRQKQEADADEILKVYEGAFSDDASKAAIRNILLNDKEAGIAILNGLKKPEADAAGQGKAEKKTPPEAMHDPSKKKGAGEPKLTDEEMAVKVSKRAKELQAEAEKKGGKLTFQEAWSQAEKEIKTTK